MTRTGVSPRDRIRPGATGGNGHIECGTGGPADTLNEIGKEQAELLQTRVGIEFQVEGDARYLSHHDMMRQMEHAVGRAAVPIAYSAGFNPRPKLSLPLPRPVGIASRAELVILRLTEPTDANQLCQRLAAQMPEGVTLAGSRPLEHVRTMHAAAASYELALSAPDADTLAARLADLHSQPSWPCHRPSRKAHRASRDLELRDLVTALAIDDGVLRFTLTAVDAIWARIPEVLEFLGIDSPQMRCRVVRTAVQWVARTSKAQPFEPTE